MFEYVTDAYNDEEVLGMLRPYTAKWFRDTFKTFTPPQRMAIPLIKSGNNVLISSPTGTGKTLAVFLALLDTLYHMGERGTLENKIYVVYVSPLRALNNDMRRNLLQPIKGIEAIAKSMGFDLPSIRVAVRTSDTSPTDKQKMLTNPPHILITTPESLAIVLVAPRFRKLLQDVKWVIIDEIHELANSKRGSHLSLSIERLEHLTGNKLIRIGLSATIAPLEEVALFLVGYDEEGKPRPCKIVDARFTKPIDIKVLCPVKDLIHTDAEEVNEAIYNVLTKLIASHRTTLVFTNTRSATERVVYKLRKIMEKERIVDADEIEAHHSSLSRDLRLDIEERLKKGKLRAVVCVSPESKVLTIKGWKKIVDVESNDNVLYMDFSDFRLKPGSFEYVFIDNYNDKGYLIETSLGFKIKCTPDHKFLVIENSTLYWKNADNLKEGDKVAIIRNIAKSRHDDITVLDFLPENAYLELRENFLSKLRRKIYEKYHSIRELANKIGINPSTLVSNIEGRYPFRYGNLKKVLKALNNVKLGISDIKFIRTIKRKHKIKPFVVDPYFMRFFGFWLAEGSWYNNGIRIFSSDIKLLDKYKNLIIKIFGINPKLIKTSSGIYGYDIPSKLLLEIFRRIIGTSRRKTKEGKFPDFIYRLNKECISQFLSGYFDGDGYLEVRNGRIYSACFTTFNKEYADGIQKLLLYLGILSSQRRRNYNEEINFCNRVIRKQGTCYTVSILGGEYLRRFKAIIDPWREDLKSIKNLNNEGYSNRDTIPGISKLLREIREELGLSYYQVYRAISYNPYRIEHNLRNISRRNLIKLLEFYEKVAKLKDKKKVLEKILFLKSLALGDIFFDTIIKKETIELNQICSLVNVTNENYVIDGFICKNSSTSLELGIDIGYIDLVVLLSSPKSVSRLLQRIGRAGHHIREVSKGRIIVVDRDDLVECTVLAKAALERKIDKVHIPRNPLDVLAQHIVGMAIEKKWRVEEAYKLIKRTYTFHTLSWDDYINVLKYLSGKYSYLFDTSYVKVYAKIWYDEKEGVFGRKKGARMIYYLNSGTIPDEAKIRVFTTEGRYVGDLEEEFVEILYPGDIFVLGGRTYEYIRSTGTRIIVRKAEGQRPTVPTWYSEMLPLEFDSALEVSKFRRIIGEMIVKYPREKVVGYLIENYNLEPHAAEAIYEYFYEQYVYTNGLIPSDKLLLIEIWNEGQLKHIIFHTLFGRRVNNALSRAYAYILGSKVGTNVRITVSDNGFILSIPPHVNIDRNLVEGLIYELNDENIDEYLKIALRYSEILKRRFRHCAERALMLLKRYKGIETSLYRRQVNSEALLKILLAEPDFPVIKETFREILEDYMDIDNAKKVLRWIRKGEIDVKVIEVSYAPSPFSHGMVAQGYSDVVLMRDRKKLLQKLHELIAKYIENKRFISLT